MSQRMAAASEPRARQDPDLARVLGTGITVGSADDSLERVADSRAQAALAGPIIGTARSTPITAAPSLPGLGTGQPLSPAMRDYFEPRFGADLRGIRLHTDERAAAASAGLGARAFSREGHIAIGPWPDGREQSLAHELAHVVEGHSGLRRQAMSSPSPTQQTSAPEPASLVCEPEPQGGVCSIDETIVLSHPDGYNPCAVNVTRLTNYELLGEYNAVLEVIHRGREAPGYFDHRNLQRRLIEERDRRIEMGHAWLASMPQSLPPTVYQVVDNPDGSFTVLAATGLAVSGLALDVRRTPFMTRGQFDRFLETHSVERVDADTYRVRIEQEALRAAGLGAAVPAIGLHQSLRDVRMAPGFSVEPTSNAWQGRLGELSFTAEPKAGFGYAVQDLNAVSWIDRRGVLQNTAGTQANYPVMDYQRVGATRGSTILGVRRFSVKAPLSSNVASRMNTYAEGLATIYQSGRSNALQSYIANQPEFAGQPTSGPVYDTNRSGVIAESSLAVNSDDVAQVRRLLSDPSLPEGPTSATSVWNERGGFAGGQRRAAWREVFTGAMRERPVRIGTQLYATPDALDAALANGTITAAEHLGAQREVGRLVAGKVTTHGTSTADLAIMRSRRAAIPLTEAQMAPLITSEAVAAARVGELPAGLLAGGRAGVGGAVIAVVTTSGVMLLDEADHPNWAQELGVAGALGGSGAAVGGFTEQLVVSVGTQMTMRAAATGSASAISRAGLQGLGRFGGGAVGAMFVESVSMGLLEEREHSGLEVGVRLGRSGALGGASIWTGAAVGAAAGSAVPVAGTAVGFIVGLVVGAGLYYLGDKLVPGGKDYWDAVEAGCQPSRPSRSPDDERFRFCFAAETAVALADGRDLPIRELVTGDLVLSYNERTLTVEPRPVLKVHRGPATAMLDLTRTGGPDVRTTPAHRFATVAGWTRAADLQAGDRLLGLEGDGVVPTTLDAVRPTMPDGPVFDLEVDATHTYFAEGLLVHNKVF